MPAPAVIGCADVVQGKFSGVDPFAEFEEFPLHGPHRGPAHFAKDAAGLCQDKFGLEKYDAFVDGKYFCLAAVQCNPEAFTNLVDPFQAALQVLHAFVDQIAVVHVPGGALDPELLLDYVVKQIGKHERGVLRDLTPEAVPDRAEVLKEVVRIFPGHVVVDTPAELVLDGPMLGVAEVVGKVENEDTALKAVLPVVPVQVPLQTVKRKVDPFIFRARAVVIDKSRLKNRRDHAVAEVPLDRSLTDMDTADMPPFAAVVKVKLVKAAAFIRALY